MASTLIASDDTLGEVLHAHLVVDHGHDQSQVHLFTRDHLRLLAALL
jgi:MOSC domain-containing protein YiiM